MSRTLRSAALVAQSLAGPSRPMLRPRIAAPVFVAPAQTRSLFGLPDVGLPKSWRKAMRRDNADDVKETEEVKEVDPAEVSKGGLFDEVIEEAAEVARSRKISHEHRYKSGQHKMSHRKLNDISRQVAGLPVDEAIVQLVHGSKRAGRTWVKSTLALARDHAEAKGLRRDRLVVAETFVSKGPKVARVDIKGRGRLGIKHHPTARIHFVLREGKTYEEKLAAERKKVLNKVRSAGIVREDGKIRRKFVSGWAW